MPQNFPRRATTVIQIFISHAGADVEIAERLARATISGAGALLDADRRQPACLRAEVTSPGGTTEAALRVLMQNEALERLLHKAVAAARRRAEELREQG